MAAADDTRTIEYLITANIEPGYTELRKLEMSLMRILTYIKRFCGNEQIDKAIDKIQVLITAIRAAQIAIRALEAAEGPVGWIYAATTTIGAVITGLTAVQELGS